MKYLKVIYWIFILMLWTNDGLTCQLLLNDNVFLFPKTVQNRHFLMPKECHSKSEIIFSTFEEFQKLKKIPKKYFSERLKNLNIEIIWSSSNSDFMVFKEAIYSEYKYNNKLLTILSISSHQGISFAQLDESSIEIINEQIKKELENTQSESKRSLSIIFNPKMTLMLEVNLCRYVKTLCALRPLQFKNQLRTNDFETKEVCLTSSNINHYIAEIPDNSFLLKSMTTGEYLTRSIIAQNMTIKMGDTVQLKLMKNKIIIKATAKALQSGKIGEYILVRPNMGHNEIRAQIINSQLVEVTL